MFLENAPVSARLIRDAFETWADDAAWPSWSFSNHDVVRVRSRWKKPDAGDSFAQMLLGLLMCLRGTIFLYQGEELGLPQADVPFEKLQDPEGKTFWPDNLGRDGCRTPMPWRADAPNAGFSVAEPWLPVDPRHHALAVDRQEGVAGSTLERTKKFIAARRGSNALRLGGIRFLDAPDDIVLFERSHDGERLLCAFNLGAKARAVAAPAGAQMIDYGLPAELLAGRLLLPPFGGAVLKTVT
jgi:alpha-glucosidase